MFDTDESEYLELLELIIHFNKPRTDRTGVGTYSTFGTTMKFHDVKEKFPLLTTKEMNFDSIKSELLWMLEGSSDERRLAEIRYGKSREELEGKKTIWTANAHADYWVNQGLKKSEGDLGRVYGVQWRDWNYGEEDQIEMLIDGIKNDPFSRRHLLTSYNPGELTQMALPPCHLFAQYYVREEENGFYLDSTMYQRSADLFLGSPYNIAFYSMMQAMIAQVCDLKTGNFTYMIGDAHVYLNHVDAVNEQLTRTPLPQPKLVLNTEVKNIDDFTMEDIWIENYEYLPKIKAPMAV